MLLRILLLLALASPLTAQGLSTRLSQVDSSRFPTIGVLLGVFSGAGQPVSGLTKDDFTIDEDGQNVKVLSVEVERTPISLALVLDTSGSMKPAMDEMKTAATDFLRSLDPSDRVMLVNFSDKPTVRHELTTNRKDLVETVAGLEPEGATSLYDAMHEAIQGVRRVEGRKLAVIFTDGRDQSADGSRPQSSRTVKAVVAFAKESQVPLWTVALGKEVDNKLLGKIAAITGGRSYDAAEAGDLRKAFGDIATDVRLQYRLTYGTPKEKRDGSWRALAVTSAEKGQRGQGKTRYQAPGTSTPSIATQDAPVVAKGAPLAAKGAPAGAASGQPVQGSGLAVGSAGTTGLNVDVTGAGGANVSVTGEAGGNVSVTHQGGVVGVDVGATSVTVEGADVNAEIDGDLSVETGDGSVEVGADGVQVEGDGGSVDIGADGIKVESSDGNKVEIKDGGISIDNGSKIQIKIPGLGGN